MCQRCGTWHSAEELAADPQCRGCSAQLVDDAQADGSPDRRQDVVATLAAVISRDDAACVADPEDWGTLYVDLAQRDLYLSVFEGKLLALCYDIGEPREVIYTRELSLDRLRTWAQTIESRPAITAEFLEGPAADVCWLFYAEADGGPEDGPIDRTEGTESG